MGTLYYEDVAIGDSLPVLKKGPVTLTDLVKYSGASGDFNPLHTVPEYARSRAGLPDVIAHGMLNMAYAGQLITDWMGPDGELKRLKSQFRGMTFLGDEVRCEGVVADKEQTAEGNLVTVNIVLTAGRESRRTVIGNATVALPSSGKGRARKPAPAKTKAPTKRKAAAKAKKKAAPAKKKAVKKKAVKKKATKKKAVKKTAAKKRVVKKKTSKKPVKKKAPAKKKKAAKRRRR